MALNPDPRPGRWLLPLVVLGMVGFTYVFVQTLPGSEADGLDVSSDEVSTSTTTTTIDLTETTTTTIPLSPDFAAYLETVDGFETELTAFQTEMATINGQWDAREIEYSVAETALIDLAGRVGAWLDGVIAVIPPAQLTTGNDILVQAASAASDAARDVVAGIQAPTADPRVAALEQFDAAVLAFTAAADDLDLQARSTS